jgi:LysR family transcriptional regulator, hypochlorite-specific transcription factor HypT
MELKWLEDFISLAETRNFSRSAEFRHVTQPAFSRRIRSLEAWVGAVLIDRTAYPTRLTPAGELFYEQAVEMLAQISSARALLRGQQPAPRDTIDFALPHNLALAYFPKWLSGVEKRFGEINSRLFAGNVHDAVMALSEGGCDLLLCYQHPLLPVQLDASRYDMLVLGKEFLYAYSPCDRLGEPLYRLPGRRNAPLPFLSYTPNAYLGRMVELILTEAAGQLHLNKRYETDMAESLKAMALEGHGIAFLPESAVVHEVRHRQLALAGDPMWGAEMEIRLYRERRTGKPIVERLWQHLLSAGAHRKAVYSEQR